MIYFATLIRVNDGLALCASTDLDTTFEMKESKKRLKLLSKKVGQLPARCTSKIGTYSLHFTRTGSLCTMMICSSQYPEILAFSFLTDLQREFLQQYKNEDIQKAKRPYTFVEFDMFIQRMKQRYSNTSSLTSRINVNDISEDLKQNPPYEINNSELYQHNGSTMTSYKNSGKVKIVLPLNWLGYLSGALCCVCALLNILRFVPLFAYYGAENEDHSVTAALAFLVGALLNVLLNDISTPALLLIILKVKVFCYRPTNPGKYKSLNLQEHLEAKKNLKFF
ncbi:vesicle-trafficking protein SEC22a-like isoform X2 [Xenia sp. Carnegie-2017]|uniref:vesicle-trafficking protein SEC22a-like isoform X2 n=1 Tax=Xenia sp. Carnegie-2017 TaxID=2897299 RepID=UPI001F03B310|nr:vesicle-trafficking protein SEC22a-like isoform X2 [Xenia sp. Carnegie-2017]